MSAKDGRMENKNTVKKKDLIIWGRRLVVRDIVINSADLHHGGILKTWFALLFKTIEMKGSLMDLGLLYRFID